VTTREVDFFAISDFCFLHKGELETVPDGKLRGYPMDIDFDNIPVRIERMVDDLNGIINGTVSSILLDYAKEVRKQIGNRARAVAPMILMGRFTEFLVSCLD
jgi:hypothetical protein